MSNASQVIIAGCSAGALGVYLGLDQMSDIIQKSNSNIVVRGFSDSGFFLDYTSNYVSPIKNIKNNITGRDEAYVNNILDYSKSMKNLFEFSNMQSGANQNCVNFYKTVKSENNNKNNNKNNTIEKCVFASYLSPFIRTPLFAIQVIKNI
jgi:hypothetical protein